jgi:hypothetical protein
MHTHDVEYCPEHDEDMVQTSVIGGRRNDQGWPLVPSTLIEALAMRAYLTLVHVFHAIPLQTIRGWHVHYPDVHA